jgi:hypothetical protein
MAKSKGGRPRIEVPWSDVEKLCGLQCTQDEIALFTGISVDTLDRAAKREHGVSFAEYFRQKRGTGRIALRRAQWQAAQKGNPTMLIWLGKQHLDQKDKTSTELSGPDGKPIEFKNPEAMSKEEIQAEIASLLAKRGQ